MITASLHGALTRAMHIGRAQYPMWDQWVVVPTGYWETCRPDVVLAVEFLGGRVLETSGTPIELVYNDELNAAEYVILPRTWCQDNDYIASLQRYRFGVTILSEKEIYQHVAEVLRALD